MFKLILLLLIVAAIAGLLGFGRVSGAALTGATLLIGIGVAVLLIVIAAILALT